jgi:hypothetical protein
LADKEHPAAKAGRYVRAAGIVLGKEIDRRAAAADAKAAAPPPPPPPPPPLAVETHTFVGRWIFRFFVFSLVVLGLSLLHFDELLPGTGEKIVRLTLAAILGFTALVLLTNWQRGNERIGQRLLNRMWGPRAAVTKRERFVARTTRDVLTLVGIGFLAAAVYQLLVGTIGM